MHIKITQPSPSIINLIEYNCQQLDIAIEKNVQFSCMLNQVQENMAITFHVKEHAILNLALLVMNAQNIKIDLTILLDGEYAQAHLRGLYILNACQHVAITTRQEHGALHTSSDLKIKGLLHDSSTSLYQGTIYIHQGAKHSTAIQENKNILLSKYAHAQSVPSLEVLTNDVSCKHGSAVGYFDEQELFYMQTRGLDSENAKKLLLRGFCAEIIDAFSPELVLDILKYIEEKIT